MPDLDSHSLNEVRERNLDIQGGQEVVRFEWTRGILSGGGNKRVGATRVSAW